MTLADLSNGLPAEKETVVPTQPTEPFWAENLLFAPYDPKCDIGMWLHLGTVPTDWSFWEDRILISLPGDEGVLVMWGYYRSVGDARPGGPNLHFKLVEPFKRWKVTFDGFALPFSKESMTGGALAVASGRHRRLVIDLDIECKSPAWDAQSSAHSDEGKGDMTTQGWAKEHYEQVYTAKGVVHVDQKTYPFDGMGWRDHSRGPRGSGKGAPWGGHMIVGGLWPSGRSAVFSSYWAPDGTITLEGAVLTDANGAATSAEVLDPPRLRELVYNGEVLKTTLKHAGGEARLTLTCDKSIWTAMTKHALGVDMSGNGLHYILNWGRCEWEGEIGHFYMERSDPLSLPPITLKPAR